MEVVRREVSVDWGCTRARERERESERERPNRATNGAGGWAGERNANWAGATTKRAERKSVT